MGKERTYSSEPGDKKEFTKRFDRFYTTFAVIYDIVIKVLPVWKRWLEQAIPYIQGPRVLEVSFGTGYLLTQYADRFETYGIDYNEKMVSLAKNNLSKKGISVNLQEGAVEAIPYGDEYFDTVINTMAFTGYPDGTKAMSEMYRVLRTGGRLIIIDVNYPRNRNFLGMKLARFWEHSGDLIRDMDKLLDKFDFEYKDIEIGGFGSTHLYLCNKK